jgi:hypothetical protein
MPLPVLVLLAAMNQSGAALGPTADLGLEPVISEAKYCGKAGGEITLYLRFILHFQNNTQTPIILPMFAVLSGYELFSDEAALKLNRSESSVSIRRNLVLDAAKLDSSTPDPKLFRTLQPGDIWSAYESLSIVLQPAHGDGLSLLGKDRYLRLRMNPWPAERKTGEKLRTLWQRYGVLRMTEVPSLPLKLHVEDRPRAGACPVYVD